MSSSTAPHQLTPPDFMVKISVVTLLLTALILTTPITLTILSVYNVKATMGRYVPARVYATAGNAANSVRQPLIDSLQRTIEVAGASLDLALEATEGIVAEDSSSVNAAQLALTLSAIDAGIDAALRGVDPSSPAAPAALTLRLEQALGQSASHRNLFTVVSQAFDVGRGMVEFAAGGPPNSWEVSGELQRLSPSTALWLDVNRTAFIPTPFLWPEISDGFLSYPDTSGLPSMRVARATVSGSWLSAATPTTVADGSEAPRGCPAEMVAMPTSESRDCRPAVSLAPNVDGRLAISGSCVPELTSLTLPRSTTARLVSFLEQGAIAPSAVLRPTGPLCDQRHALSCVPLRSSRAVTWQFASNAFATTGCEYQAPLFSITLTRPLVADRVVSGAGNVLPQTLGVLQYTVQFSRDNLQRALGRMSTGTGQVIAVFDSHYNMLSCIDDTLVSASAASVKSIVAGSVSGVTGCRAALLLLSDAAVATDVSKGTIGVPSVAKLTGGAHEAYDHLVRAFPIFPPSSATCGSDAENVYALAMLPTSTYSELQLVSIAKIVVTAFAIGGGSVILMLLLMRSLMHPLKALTKAIYCCASMRLEDMEIMEASSVSEIAEIQRSVAYLAIRLYHYARFLPDRVVLSNEAADEDDDAQQGAAKKRPSNDRRTADSTTRPRRRSVFDELADAARDDSTAATDDGRDDADDDSVVEVENSSALEVPLLAAVADPTADGDTVTRGPDGELDDSPLHTITVSVTYDTGHPGEAGGESPMRSGMLKSYQKGGQPARFARFPFRYRATEAVHTKLLRMCRKQLNERPGEVLVLFVHTPDGKRQLTNNEDVLFAFEYFGNNAELSNLRLSVMKANVRTSLPALIAASTVLSAVSRLVLSGARMSDTDSRVQIIGVLLLACLGTQIAQNTLITAYLLSRFGSLETEFKLWKQVSARECKVGVFLGAFNVTNIEVLASHLNVCDGWLHLSAPLTTALIRKVRKYSLMGFLVGDLIPFIIIVIETILRRSYRDPFVLLSLFFSVLSVVSILVRHGIIRFVMDVAMERNRHSVRSQATKTMILSRKEVSLLRIGFAEPLGLTAMLTSEEVELVSEALYTAIAPVARKYGGLLIASRGTSFEIVFNAHTVIPAHANAALLSYRAIATDVSKHVAPFLLRVQRLSHKQKFGGAVEFDRHRAIQRHRLIASIVSGEMCLGYVGTLTSQTFQHVDSMHSLSKALLNMNELYGTCLLVNGTMQQLMASGSLKTPMCCRRIDRVSLRSASQNLATRQLEFFRKRDLLIEEMRQQHAQGDDTMAAAGELEDLEKAFRRANGSELGEIVEHDVVEVLTKSLDHDAKDLEGLLDDVGESILDQYTVVNSHHTMQQMNDNHHGSAGVNRVTMEAAARFDAAMCKMHHSRDPADVVIYAKSMTCDSVAQAVTRWARWMNAVNEAEGICFPRPIVSMGPQLHKCEMDSRLIPRGNRDAYGDLLGLASSDRREARKRLLRPPRSERRLHDSRRPPPLPVLERVIGSDRFDVTFEARCDDGPVVDV